MTLDATTWQIPDVFKWMAGVGGMPSDEMYRTFNSGVGMACIVSSDRVKELTAILEEHGETVSVIGQVIAAEAGSPLVQITNADTPWQS